MNSSTPSRARRLAAVRLVSTAAGGNRYGIGGLAEPPPVAQGVRYGCYSAYRSASCFQAEATPYAPFQACEPHAVHGHADKDHHDHHGDNLSHVAKIPANAE